MAATIRSELAAAIRAVNAEFARLPESARSQLDLSTNDLDRELDRTLLGGDRDCALRVIEAWRDHHLVLIRRSAR